MAYVTYSLEGDKRVVYKTLPKKAIQALIIYKRYMWTGMVQPIVGTNTFVVEATVLHNGGREHAEYQKALLRG
jgi:hypothetical protein